MSQEPRQPASAAPHTCGWGGARRLARIAVSATFIAACASTPLSSPAPAGAPAQRSDPDASDLLSLVPGDAGAVLVVDLRALRQSPWTRAVFPPAQGRPTPRGFDELFDVDSLVMVRPSTASPGAPSLELMRGRFDEGKIGLALARAWPAATRTEHRGRTLIVGPDDQALALVGTSTLAAGPLAQVRGAIDTAFGRAPGVQEERWFVELREAVEEEGGRAVSGRPSTVELALQVDEPVRALLGETLGPTDSLERIGARLDVGNGLSGVIVGVTPSRSAARVVVTQSEQALTTLQNRRSMQALGLSPLFARLSLNARGSHAVIGVALTEEDREALATTLAALGEALKTPAPASASDAPPTSEPPAR